ncbi:HNH endonuclease [Parashewanella tropica]|uniref:HNH endonuclease n=1 Tax=Parashewanella tropica TaxID=2547970 RepID=UPI00105A612E|nr:HNH endonuclease [Parashewanella tropica]
MKYLKALKHPDDLGWLELAISSRKKEVSSLKFIKPDITKRYKGYDSEITKFEECPADTVFPCDEDKELLIDFYEHAPKKLNEEIIKRRNKHELKDCPYCGMPLRPLTLDHFIPKSTWPEYSILPNNLVPQCRGCAPIKGEKYFDDANKQCLFISPIYSDLLEKVSLKINVTFVKSTNKYDFEVIFCVNSNIEEDDENRLVSHIKTLKVKSRIELYCKETVIDLINSCEAKKFNLRMVLQSRKEEKFVDENSVRDWQTALYLGLLDNIDFFKYLESLMPNKKTGKKAKIASKALEI